MALNGGNEREKQWRVTTRNGNSINPQKMLVEADRMEMKDGHLVFWRSGPIGVVSDGKYREFQLDAGELPILQFGDEPIFFNDEITKAFAPGHWEAVEELEERA